MLSYLKVQYNQYLVKYLEQLLNIEIKNVKKSFVCPICKKEESALIYPNNISKFYCLNPECNFKGDIFELIRATKNIKFKDDDIADFLKHKFKIEIKDDINDLLKMYEKNKFTLFPLQQGSDIPEKNKQPIPGFMWTEKLYTDSKNWKDWIDRGYGLALRLGDVSYVAIDIDDDKTYEKVKDLLGEDTLIQITRRGKHWLFVYEEWMKDINHINFRSKGYDMEIRANNAYIAIAPSSCDGEIRKWNNKKIKKMPKELKEFLLNLIDKNTKNVEEEIQEAIDKNELDLTNGLRGLDGQCNDVFIKFGGILRKKLNIDQTKYTLHYFNQLLEDPMDKKTIKGMFYQLDKYQTYDKQELANEVLKRLEIIKEGTAFQIAGSLKREQKDIEDVLKYLDDNNKVIHLKNRKYQVLQSVEWTTEKGDLSIPLDFQVPYFSDYARFDVGEFVIIGGVRGTGKTHLVGNIVKKLTIQNIKPYLINTEAGSKIGKITHQLGIPDNMYYVPKRIVKHPTDIELVDNAVTLIDWLKVKDGDFARTDETYEHFKNQLRLHKGFLIIFTQLRKSNSKFFAEDQNDLYASLVTKYLFGNGGTDSENTYFLTEKIRDSKTGQQHITIPTHYDKDTKILEVRK